MAELKAQDFTGKVVLFKLTKNYERLKGCEPDMWDFELYEASRGYWVMNFEEAKHLEYVLPVHDGEILEVYKVADWYKAGTTLRSPKYIDPDDISGRCEFVGNIAPEEIRKKYKGHTVTEMYLSPKSNPVRIIINGVMKSAQ